jgi:hypothetical protein
VSQDFRLKDYSCISFPQAPEFPIRAVSNFSENSRRYSQLKVLKAQMKKLNYLTPVANNEEIMNIAEKQ